MYKFFPILLSILVIPVSSLADANVQSLWKMDIGNHPEAVIFDGTYVYASNMGAIPDLLEDGDGFIAKLDAQGKLINKYFIPPGKLNSPMGMAILNQTLFVLDVNRVVSFDKESGEQLGEISLANHGASFLNDIVVINSDTLIITETDAKKIFRIHLIDNGIEELNLPLPLNCVNGLDYDPSTRTLYLVQNKILASVENNGELIAIDLDTNPIQIKWQKTFGYFLDGVQVLDGKIFVSEWLPTPNGMLTALNRDSHEIIGLYPLPVNGFAHFAIDPNAGYLTIFTPHFVDGFIEKIALEGTAK